MTLMVATWIVGLVVVVAIVAALFWRRKHPGPIDRDWREDPAEGEVRLTGGPGMGNGGVWN